MTADERRAEVVGVLETVGVSVLIMGGHAAQFYGIQRTTIDFDVQTAPETWDELPARLARSPLARTGAFQEGDSWRPNVFRRFRIGRLADGREEWPEF